MMNDVCIYTDPLEHTRYPKDYRLERKKVFFESIPKWIYKDIAKLIYSYVDGETFSVDIHFSNVTYIHAVVFMNITHSIPNTTYMNKKLYLQTPEMVLAFDPLNMNTPGLDRYDISLQIDTGIESHQNFLDSILYIEQKAKQCLTKKLSSMHAINMCSSIKYPTDRITGQISNIYPPTFRFKHTFNNNEKCIYFYDKSPITMNKFKSNMKRGNRVQAILQVSAVWISKNNSGLKFKPVQLKVKKSFENSVEDDYLFGDSE